MKKHLLLFLSFVICGITKSQTPCSSGRFLSDIFQFSQNTGVAFGQNATFTGSNYNLTMDIYEPSGDTAAVRPLIVWAHGGSFLGGTSADYDVTYLAKSFAKKGYVCASINYRTGFFPIDSANAVKAVIRAMQDMKASVRFFYKDRKTGTNLYRIDTNKIFIGGSSAGAITSLHYAYLDSTCEVNPYVSQSTLTALGGSEGNSGNPCYSSKIHGVINLCGALASYSWFEAGDVPLCSMHGTTDGTVKYNRGVANPGTPLLYLDGSRMLYERALAIGVQNDFYTFHGAGHVPYAGTSTTQQAYMDTTVNFIRDFLIKQLGCTDPGLQPANTPAQTAFLYPYSSCSTHVVQSFCNVGISDGGMLFNDIATIYPNPATETLFLDLKKSSVNYSISLIDQFGREVVQRKDVSGKIEINKVGLSDGFYLIKITSESGEEMCSKIILSSN